ncbi:glycosyltransferase [Dinoroseobacter sp. S124A]|uniref:glycosyltransferase n=1 Tax=Dinoroseobacter sp. S124A TaxID=3415128 RepID=UPI003C7C6E90
MRDLHLELEEYGASDMRPIGFFVQDGLSDHALRVTRIIDALPPSRSVTVFCPDPTLIAEVAGRAEVIALPSFSVSTGKHVGHAVMPGVDAGFSLGQGPMMASLIRADLNALTRWFDRAHPALLMIDESAEIARLARRCDVPHVVALKHGMRQDEAHDEMFSGAEGLLAPFHKALAQPDWSHGWTGKTHFAAGLERLQRVPERQAARRRLNLPEDATVILALTDPTTQPMQHAAVIAGARAVSDCVWLLAGDEAAAGDPSNLRRMSGDVTHETQIAAADLVISNAGDVISAEILSARRPWIVVPEWSLCDAQIEKARALSKAGAAHMRHQLPGYEAGWRQTLDIATQLHDPARQAALDHAGAAAGVAAWLEGLAAERNAPVHPMLPAIDHMTPGQQVADALA